MATLFRRDYLLTVDRLQFSELDIAFKVRKSIKGEPNKCELRIWNLNADHRAELLKRSGSQTSATKRKPVHVELEAGYVGSRSLIFRGDLRDLQVVREGADFVTQIAGSDGGRTYKVARVNQSFGPGVSVAQVISTCAQAMGLGVGNSAEASADATAIFPEGTVLSGNAADQLDRVLKSIGLTWSIQNGVLQLQKRGQPLASQAILLSPDTGLIGSPTMEIDVMVDPNTPGAAQTAQKKRGIVTAKVLMIPGIDPGRKVVLESDGFEGGYQITQVDYSGEFSASASSDWGAELKLRSY